MAIDHIERELRRLGDGDLAKTVADVHDTFKKRHPNLSDIGSPFQRTPTKEAQLSQSAANEAPVKLTPEDQDRQLRDAMRLFIQEYQSQIHTPELVNHTWQGIWKVVGEAVSFEYQVSLCERTSEELAQLQKESRAVLLLPNDIYTPDGFVRLGRAFPLMRSWTTDPKEVARISHGGSNTGGCIDIEMSLDAPYRTPKGYRQQELVDRITADGRRGQRLQTYLVGSQFSQLLTGHYFDENTWSRLPGSFRRDRMLHAFFRSDGRLAVGYHWSPKGQHPRMGGRTEGVKRA